MAVFCNIFKQQTSKYRLKTFFIIIQVQAKYINLTFQG